MKKDIGKKAIDYFTAEYNCAQSVLMAILDQEDMMFKEAKYLPAGFGAGMGYQCSNCGALSGGIMALGILCGEEDISVREHTKLTYQLTADLIEKFEKEFGSRICDELIEVDMKNPDELQRAREEDIFYSVCVKFIEKVVEFVYELVEKTQ